MTQKNISMRQIRRHRVQTCACQVRGAAVEEDVLGVWDQQAQAISYVECISKFLLCSTGNDIQYSVINYNGKGMKKNTYVRMTESLCCTAEVNATL